ncbi:MAG: hypothetical protein ACRC3B_11295, partial [Bacteroidia bacterium]
GKPERTEFYCTLLSPQNFSQELILISFGLADKLLIHPLKSKILQTAAKEQWFIKHPELIASKTELENLTQQTEALKTAENGKAPSKELTDLIEQTRNAEQKYLAALNKAINNAKNSDLGPDQQKAYLNEVKRLKTESDNAFKEFELTLALAGIVMPADSAGNVDFYPIRPGEIGFSEPAREFIKAKFESFTEVTPDSGVYLATQKDGSSVIFLSEKGVESKMLENDPLALAGYMRYKNATGKRSVFEVLDAFEGMRFEGMKDYFIEYERKAVDSAETRVTTFNSIDIFWEKCDLEWLSRKISGQKYDKLIDAAVSENLELVNEIYSSYINEILLSEKSNSTNFSGSTFQIYEKVGTNRFEGEDKMKYPRYEKIEYLNSEQRKKYEIFTGSDNELYYSNGVKLR